MAEQTKGYRQRWIALAFMGIALLVISLDNTVLNLALPSIAKDLGSSGSQLQWIIDAYVLAIAGLLLTMGYLGDRLGRKPTLMVGLVIFRALFARRGAFQLHRNAYRHAGDDGHRRGHDFTRHPLDIDGHFQGR